MIDNVVLLITGTLHERDTTELLEKCHPLGMFDSMATLSIATNINDLYNSVLVDTPLGMFCIFLFIFGRHHASRIWTSKLTDDQHSIHVHTTHVFPHPATLHKPYIIAYVHAADSSLLPLLTLLQLLTFKVVCPRKTWTKWTLRLFVTRCPRLIWKISTTFANS